MSQDSASLIAQEKRARREYDRLMAAVKAHDDSDPLVVRAELDQAKRDWEAARKSLDVFQGELGR
jgi:hypothetical protein